ncbi:endonuclease/exonuclease/phosphatase family protein [Dyella sp.]|jgi:endonuclease/exonuclease/phosphatase family metal-dependent hydrolase|uniref:endonuclease/exonuclease/phosphatase family protein n=1 Tax=Dyella sp. TaxID=1869338 RepID=UPI002D792001|nr:endonuclease/exonuclease/phosphatase family protein [Dyella sp.]HET6432936.1 endonuclease/exonuclease/phosphatase family protein [Dyella sp.]
MSRLIRWPLAALLLSLLAACATAGAPRPPPDLRVMTFNVRLPAAGDGVNVWEHRRDLFVRTVREADPDVFGTQELHKEQGDYVVAKLPGYRWFGDGRRGGDGDEHMGVFYRSDRLAVIESGNFWLSDTPDVPGSISWGHPFPRMVTWALFERRADGRRFYFFNTHLPYRDEDEAARTRGANEILARLRTLPENVPVVLTGDFNTTPASDAHALLSRVLVDARAAARERAGPDATFHNFTGTPDRRIDWILTRGFTAQRTDTITTHEGALYPSDHFPVLAVLRWNPPAARTP